MIQLFCLVIATAMAGERCQTLFEAEAPALARELDPPAPARRLEELALNRALGLTWGTAIKYRPPNPIPYADLEEIFARAEATYRGHYDGPEAKVFFQSHPATFLSQLLTSELGIPAEGHIFAMYLHPDEIDAHFDRNMHQFWSSHVRDALGYLRYYRVGGTAVVVEIQNDLNRSIKPELRRRYRAWAKILVLAFERFSHDHLGDREVFIAGPEYQVRRWPNLNPGQAEAMYDQLPARLDYHPARHAGAFETPSLTGPIDVDDDIELEPLAIGAGYARDLSNVTPSRQRQKFARHYRAEKVDRLVEARAELATLVPARAPIQAPKPLAPDEPAAMVVFTEMPAELRYKNDHSREIDAYLRQTRPEWLGALANKTFVSAGRAAFGQNVEREIGPYVYRHSVGQERHPSVQAGPEYLTLKGAGRRSVDPKFGLASEVHAFCEKGEYSHRVWGGQLESQAIWEFNMHLQLWQLARLARIEPGIARPVDIGYARGAVDGDRVIDADEYQDRHLCQSPERLVQTRYLAKSAARVSAVPEAIFSTTFPERIQPLLREAYAAAGEHLTELRPPRALLGREDHALALRYLAEVARRNRDAGARVLKSWTKRSSRMMRLLHGYGGHWGGTGPGGAEGAIFGGATQARNVSLAGELRDLDNNVYLPRRMQPARDHRDQRLTDHVRLMQTQDERHWRESRYWMSVLLLGRADAPDGVVLPRWILGDPGDRIGQYCNKVTMDEAGHRRSEFLNKECTEASRNRSTEGKGGLRPEGIAELTDLFRGVNLSFRDETWFLKDK